MTLHERIQLLMAAFVVLLAVTGLVSAVTVGSRDDLVGQAARYNAARDQANQLLTDLVDQATAIQSYVITSDDRFLQPLEAGSNGVANSMAGLQSTLVGDPAILDTLKDVEVAARTWRNETVEPQVKAVEEGRAEDVSNPAATQQAVQSFGEVRSQLMQLRDEVRARQDAVEVQLAAARRRINIALVVSFGTGVLLLFAINAALIRWSSRPLAQITTAMRDVTDGDLNRRIPSVGPRDVAALGEDAELMRRRIVTELDSARRAEQALRSQGAIVSVLREELGPSQQALPASLAMAAGFEPVMGVLAGDWYDVLCLDDGAVALCLIDVSGHGQSTGVFALQAKNLMLAGARQLLSPGAVLEWMARALGDTGDNFLTCFIARIDPEDGSCEYASAGHLPAFVTSEHRVDELGPTGPLLGPLPGSWTTEKVQLQPAGQVIVYTDGITEARGADNEEFGEDRLRAVVAARAGEHPTNVIATCMDAVHDFAQGDANDDLTIVAVRWLPRPPD